MSSCSRSAGQAAGGLIRPEVSCRHGCTWLPPSTVQAAASCAAERVHSACVTRAARLHSSARPGAVSITLKAGQAVFWTGALLHRGDMRHDRERTTLECHWTCPPPAAPPVGSTANLSPGGKHWLLKPGVRESFTSPVIVQAYDNWCNSAFRGHVVQ